MRLAAAGAAEKSSGSADQLAAGTVSRATLLKKKLARYMKEDPAKEADDFSLLGFWHQRTTRTTSVAAMPHLAQISQLYYGLNATSCQAGRSVSSLALLDSNLRPSTSPQTTERMMVLRMKQNFIPEVLSYMKVVDRRRADREKCAAQIKKVQENLVGQEGELCH